MWIALRPQHRLSGTRSHHQHSLPSFLLSCFLFSFSSLCSHTALSLVVMPFFFDAFCFSVVVVVVVLHIPRLLRRLLPLLLLLRAVFASTLVASDATASREVLSSRRILLLTTAPTTATNCASVAAPHAVLLPVETNDARRFLRLHLPPPRFRLVFLLYQLLQVMAGTTEQSLFAGAAKAQWPPA